MAQTSARVEVAENPEALARRAAQWIADLAAASRGRFAIGLSGGSTPRRLYEILAEDPYRRTLPWDRIHWFWGDERFVPWDDPASNYGMTYAALLGRAPIPPENIHGIAMNGTPAEAAAAYEQVLKSYYGSAELDPARPLFDIQILGLGPDGHTASLIPGTSALDERRRWAVEVTGARPETRITLTYPVLESGRHVGELIWFADAAARPQQ
jgi:6-phosphogluconolactonase